MTHRLLLIGIVAGTIALAGCQSTPDDMDESMNEMADMADMSDMSEMDMMTTEFVVTIEVLAGSPTPLAPVAWAVHDGPNPFVVGDMGTLEGLESLAEDGDPSGVAATLGHLESAAAHGVANTPDGAASPGPATPGHSYSFTVHAHSGQRLSFATMYVQSNDLFYSPGADGLALFDMDMATHGTVTTLIHLYDAGTEMNEEPGMGAHQPLRQSGPNMGMAENTAVMAVTDVMDGYVYPPVDSVIKVSIATDGAM